MMIPIIIHRLPFEKDHQSTSIVLYASDVLSRLKTVGVLSGSVSKTLTLAPNESRIFAFGHF